MAGKISLAAEAAACIREMAQLPDAALHVRKQNLLLRLDEAAKQEAQAADGQRSYDWQCWVNVPDAVSTSAPLPRQALLQEALKITSHDRNTAYGNPEDNFANIAAYWNSYCQQRFKVALDITPQDVAHFMILMKLARLATNASHRDSLVDIAGYAACAEDCRTSKLAQSAS